jgi:hypothetical protein
MEMIDLLERAKKQLADTTGLKPEGVVRASKDNGSWNVRVEMLEMSRIPPATDMLGDYEAVLDEGGAMLRFERKRTRLRGEPLGEQPA